MSTTAALDADVKGSTVSLPMYRGMIGSLLYSGMCARFQANPKESHLTCVKRILRYLEGTQELGLWYPRGNQELLWAYSDADHAGYKTDRKSTSGQCAFLGGCLVCWASKKVVWCVGLARSKPACHYHPQRQSILLLQAVVHKCCG